MHDAVHDLVDDQAPVEVTLRKLGIRCVPDQRRDIPFLRDKNSLLLGVEEPKIAPLRGWRTWLMIHTSRGLRSEIPQGLSSCSASMAAEQASRCSSEDAAVTSTGASGHLALFIVASSDGAAIAAVSVLFGGPCASTVLYGAMVPQTSAVAIAAKIHVGREVREHKASWLWVVMADNLQG